MMEKKQPPDQPVRRMVDLVDIWLMNLFLFFSVDMVDAKRMDPFFLYFVDIWLYFHLFQKMSLQFPLSVSNSLSVVKLTDTKFEISQMSGGQFHFNIDDFT